MTPHDTNARIASEKANYQEFRYPYVYPKGDLFENVDDGILAALTPLEGVFVQWVLHVDDPTEAITSLMNPAFPFDTTVSNGHEIRVRPQVTEAINKFRKKLPYLNKYTTDYILGLVHDEIEYVRARHRRKRYEDQGFRDAMCNGKKSVHEEEMAEINAMVELVKLTTDLTTVQAADGSQLPVTELRDTDGRVDRLLAEAQERILGRQADPAAAVGNGPP